MTLPTTDFFEKTLRAAYEALCALPTAALHLNGIFRFQGKDLDEASTFQLDDVTLTSRQAAQLLMVFDCSRVVEQEQHNIGLDDAPPGTYFTVINREVIGEGHKNRIGIYLEEGDGTSLHFGDADQVPLGEIDPPAAQPVEGQADMARAVHVDHFFLRRQAPDYLGTVTFALCAMIAHRLGFTRISLIAGGGHGHNPEMIGYFFWPKLGFDAPLEPEETAARLEFAACISVQELLAIDRQWWYDNGTQRWMEFDLAAQSPAWTKLLDYLSEKELI
ncbi:hypothetical protein FVF58_32640 [Paraburkholderia panacisoli]|uniref:Uncharacterized protein n=1 Tax=Paraburkholderia panacisoli TaxID=2603818 RepID=A0A5B0GLU5_9BURK|nr:hypothetical protein [Paraburkholderia panacisoli]KAA1004356.1 hypothetical protein FVF58_32640 [Paraburkholderia panacisoli]